MRVVVVARKSNVIHASRGSRYIEQPDEGGPKPKTLLKRRPPCSRQSKAEEAAAAAATAAAVAAAAAAAAAADESSDERRFRKRRFRKAVMKPADVQNCLNHHRSTC